MAGARYDEDIMAEFSKIERMIAEQVGGSSNHDIYPAAQMFSYFENISP